MSTAHDDLAAFQQFALQKVNTGEADTLEELFDLWLIEHPAPIEHPASKKHFAKPSKTSKPAAIAQLKKSRATCASNTIWSSDETSAG